MWKYNPIADLGFTEEDLLKSGIKAGFAMED